MDRARSLEELGAAMYPPEQPAAAPAPSPSPAPAPTQPEAAGDALPPEIQALRDADPERALYDDRTAYNGTGIDKALADLGIEGKVAEAEHKAWAGTFTDAGLTPQEAQDVVALALMEEPSADELAAWPAQAQAKLQEAFGDDAEQALADARLLVKRDPRVRDFLNRTGLGDHPYIVKLAADRARALIASGKLKRS